MKKVMPPPPVATCLAFYPQDDSIVTRKLEGHAKIVTSLAFSNTLNVLVSSGADAYWKLQLLADMASTLM
ncbi:unnamed protein product [Prunus armeniaca]